MDKARLEKEFEKAGITLPFRLYGCLDSTNTFAKMQEPPCVIIASRQTAGRGRNGKAFASPRGGLYFSILLDKRFFLNADFPQERDGDGKGSAAAKIPLICGIAAAECIEGAKVKWPNDIYLTDAEKPETYYKVAGILCESAGGKFIIGAGLNVNTKRFPKDLKDKAASLVVLRGRKHCIEETAASVISAVLRNIRDARYYDGAFLANRFEEYDFLKGREIKVAAGEEQVKGVGAGIDGQGRLRMLCGKELRFFNCGEVFFCREWPKSGY